MSRLGQLLVRLGRPFVEAARRRRYRHRLRQGRPAGDYRYVFRQWAARPALVEVRVRAGDNGVSRRDAAQWRDRQTLAELTVVGFDELGIELWRVGAEATRGPAEWFAAPGGLPDLLPAHLESCLYVVAAEEVDAVALRERVLPPIGGGVTSADAVLGDELRPYCLYRASAYAYDPAGDAVRATGQGRVVKLVDSHGVADIPCEAETFGERRRGPYLSDVALGHRLDVGVRNAGMLLRQPLAHDRPVVLVLAPFLARGGAEHTLFETLRALQDRFEFAFVTLAPHRAELGDRRGDFRQISERLFCLGDLVHPDAMPGILDSILDSLGATILYNANGSTLFYQFVPRLRAERPELRIIDHLYDHQVGYIDQYQPGLMLTVDACVAENRRIAQVLVTERGWPRDRVPVIWPCGRPRHELPAADARAEVRARLRRELGLNHDEIVFLTAARMHPQKRPLDLVELARRVRDLETVRFLMVGGGELESAVDAAVSASGGARVQRLGFRTDIPELIVAADVGCLISDYEGLPVFLLECLQAGRPFLGTAVGDMGDLLRASRAGLVVDRPGDMDALEACLRRLVDPEEWSAFAERALATGIHFEVPTCAERYAAAFLGQPVDEPHIR